MLSTGWHNESLTTHTHLPETRIRLEMTSYMLKVKKNHTSSILPVLDLTYLVALYFHEEVRCYDSHN